MRRIISHLKSVQPRRQRGTIMMLTAIMIAAIVGMVALAIDLGFIFSVRNQYKNGIDAAALAAATAMRVTIEADAGSPQQALIARAMAKQFASLNEVRRYPNPDPDVLAPNANSIVIDDAAISFDTSSDIPRVTVNSTLEVPTLFAGIVGFYKLNINARAMASLFPVDGGTGTIGSGTDRSAGCWRPIVLPDTFYDSINVPHILFEKVEGSNDGVGRIPKPENGDYYRSRFAAGARNVFPFVDPPAAKFVTGLRDTKLTAEVGTMTIMGQQLVRFRQDSYFVANFKSLPRSTFDEFGVQEWANFGYCGQVRVGDDIAVFQRGDALRIEQLRQGLIALMSRTILVDEPHTTEETLYHYVVSNEFPGPNTHGAIIPVLFYDPLDYKKDNPGIVKITNIGLFLLKQVEADGGLTGYFIREVIAGGTPIAATNFQGDSEFPQFRRSWLPMSVQLLN